MNATGLILRDFDKVPVGSIPGVPAMGDQFTLTDAEIEERFIEQQASRSSLLDIRKANYDTLKSFNQNPYPLCWAFSSTKAAMYCRAIAGLPPVILSPWYVAGNVVNWRSTGYYGAASLRFIIEHGAPAMEKCPRYARSAVTSDAAQNAELHKVTEWWDGSDNRREMQQQLKSVLVMGIPAVVDLPSMAHSMCAIAIASLNPLVILYDNSWAQIEHPEGLHIGRGADTQPGGLVIPRVSTVSPN